LNSILIKIVIRRFFELLITCAVVSVVITFLHVTDMLVTDNSLCAVLLIGVTVFVFLNVRMLRLCYYEMKSNSIYLLVNISAYLLFAAICFIVHLFCSKECFTWIFAITKFARYSNFNLETLYSAVLFHIIGICMVMLAPIGMSWIFMYDDDEIEK